MSETEIEKAEAPNKRRSFADRVRAKALFCSGVALTDVAEQLDIPANTLRTWHTRDCWTKARDTHLKRISNAAMGELFNEMTNRTVDFGRTQAELVEMLQEELGNELEDLRATADSEGRASIGVDMIDRMIGLTQACHKLGQSIFTPKEQQPKLKEPDAKKRIVTVD